MRCDDAVVVDVETAGHRLGAARIADARSRCIMFAARFAGRDDFRSSSRVRIGRNRPTAASRAARAVHWRNFVTLPADVGGTAAEEGTRIRANGTRGRCASGSRLAGRDVPVVLEDRARPCVAAPDAAFHPASGMPVLRDPLPAPEPQREVAPREPRRLALQRHEELAVPAALRVRPGGAGAPDQRSSTTVTWRISRSPASSGNPPPSTRTCTDRPSRSILSISAPSPRRSPESDAPPSATSRASGGASRETSPATTPAVAQKGASGPSGSSGSSQASMPQRMAPASASVLSRTGKGARSGRPGSGRRLSQASRYALLARMKRQARTGSQPRT